MKYPIVDVMSGCANVAPYVGAWIEISSVMKNEPAEDVSLLMWERGLKFDSHPFIRAAQAVAPYVGAWIEIQ